MKIHFALTSSLLSSLHLGGCALARHLSMLLHHLGPLRVSYVERQCFSFVCRCFIAS